MTSDAKSKDRALVIAARAGDRSQREVLARRVGRSAYVFALQLTGDREMALDVAQDGVIRFFGHLDRFDIDRPIDPWLYQIVRNRVRDLARRDRLRPAESLDEMLQHGQPAATQSTEDPAVDAERAELQVRIWRSVSLLSEDHREIFVLRDFHGLSYREIAETLSIPQGTVMSRLHAARKCLRALLTTGPDGDDAASEIRSEP